SILSSTHRVDWATRVYESTRKNQPFTCSAANELVQVAFMPVQCHSTRIPRKRGLRLLSHIVTLPILVCFLVSSCGKNHGFQKLTATERGYEVSEIVSNIAGSARSFWHRAVPPSNKTLGGFLSSIGFDWSDIDAYGAVVGANDHKTFGHPAVSFNGAF